MRTNKKLFFESPKTAEGAQAMRINPILQLRRVALAALLFEDIAYTDGHEHTESLRELIKSVKPEVVAALAVECRDRMYLRHMPLFLVRELARTKGNGTLVAETLPRIIQRPDELTEYLALYWADNKDQSISAGSKRGLAEAFKKFDAAALSKYNQKNAVKLKDVLRLVRPRPDSPEQNLTWKKLLNGELESADTWEVALSSGADKKATFERLLRERKLGGLAFLRNLRNMIQAKVDEDLIKERFNGGFNKVLPFRFIAAAKHAPKLETQIEAAMLRSTAQLPKLTGRTILVVDVSGSMTSMLSSRSEQSRLEVASALAILVREQCEDVQIYCTAGSDYTRVHRTELVPPRRGMALRDQINLAARGLGGGGIFLVQCLSHIAKDEKHRGIDRIIVLTDEQDCDLNLKPESADAFGVQNYLINISVEKNGIGYGAKWTHVDGWSERVLDFIQEFENQPGV